MKAELVLARRGEEVKSRPFLGRVTGGLVAAGLTVLSAASAQEIDLSGAQTSVTALVGVAALVMGVIITWGLVKRAGNRA